jgi:hypothetical protein
VGARTVRQALAPRHPRPRAAPLPPRACRSAPTCMCPAAGCNLHEPQRPPARRVGGAEAGEARRAHAQARWGRDGQALAGAGGGCSVSSVRGRRRTRDGPPNAVPGRGRAGAAGGGAGGAHAGHLCDGAGGVWGIPGAVDAPPPPARCGVCHGPVHRHLGLEGRLQASESRGRARLAQRRLCALFTVTFPLLGCVPASLSLSRCPSLSLLLSPPPPISPPLPVHTRA